MTGHFVHPFDDDRFIAGNATAGLEILEDLPDVDAIIAPLGGGGLLSGIAAVVRRASASDAGLRGRTRNRRAVVGLAGRRLAASTSTTGRHRLSMAPAANRCCRRCGRCCRTLAGSIVVSLDEVAQAMKLVAERTHVIAEGAAGCAIAAALERTRRPRKNRRGGVRRQHRLVSLRLARRRLWSPPIR